MHKDGFGKDEGASLKQAFSLVQAETQRLAQEHGTFASIVRENVVEPLRQWSDDAKKVTKAKRSDIEAMFKSFEKQRAEVDKRKHLYYLSCQAVEKLRMDATTIPASPLTLRRSSSSSMPNIAPTQQQQQQQQPSSSSLLNSKASTTPAMPATVKQDPTADRLDIVVTVGNVNLTQVELNSSVLAMQEQLRTTEIKYPLLGTFYTVTGEDLAAWMLKNMCAQIPNEAEAILFGQGLIDRGYLRLIGRGNKFVPKDNWNYEWKKTEEEAHLDKVQNAEKEMANASHDYKHAVGLLEQARLQFETMFTEHLHLIQSMELSRISTAKQSLFTFAASSNGLATAAQNINQSILIGLECVNPVKVLSHL